MNKKNINEANALFFKEEKENEDAVFLAERDIQTTFRPPGTEFFI